MKPKPDIFLRLYRALARKSIFNEQQEGEEIIVLIKELKPILLEEYFPPKHRHVVEILVEGWLSVLGELGQNIPLKQLFDMISEIENSLEKQKIEIEEIEKSLEEQKIENEEKTFKTGEKHIAPVDKQKQYRGRIPLFENAKVLRTYGTIKIYDVMFDEVYPLVPKNFSREQVTNLITMFYKNKAKRTITRNSAGTYASAFIRYLGAERLVEQISISGHGRDCRYKKIPKQDKKPGIEESDEDKQKEKDEVEQKKEDKEAFALADKVYQWAYKHKKLSRPKKRTDIDASIVEKALELSEEEASKAYHKLRDLGLLIQTGNNKFSIMYQGDKPCEESISP